MFPGKELSMDEFKKFYFTYGSEGHPYYGGWTEVIAPDYRSACQVFRAVHPDKTPGLLNCCSVYTEEDFDNDRGGMFKTGNFGTYCHEVITLGVEVRG